MRNKKNAKRFLSSMILKALEDGHSINETVRVENLGVVVLMQEGVIHYFVEGYEYSACDAVDLIDDILNP